MTDEEYTQLLARLGIDSHITLIRASKNFPRWQVEYWVCLIRTHFYPIL